MALARDPTPHDQLGMGSLQQSSGCLIYGNGNVQGVSDLSLPDHDSKKTTSTTTAGIVKSPPSFRPQPPMIHYQPREAHSVITFRPGRHENFMHNSGSLLSFEGYDTTTKVSHEDDSNWEDNLNYTTYQNHFMNPRVLEEFNCFPSSDYSSVVAVTATGSKENQHGEESSLGWLYTEATTVTDSIQQSATIKESSFNKRPYVGDRMEGLKRQCTAAARKPKAKSVPSKDPQSIAAKNRRERISERLKILQDLVPNGSKVDLVTMLEKAISYVKFLQLQVKVLATDEFWPVQGGKAPDISQVKEAIDAILSSQRDSNSSSK